MTYWRIMQWTARLTTATKIELLYLDIHKVLQSYYTTACIDLGPGTAIKVLQIVPMFLVVYNKGAIEESIKIIFKKYRSNYKCVSNGGTNAQVRFNRLKSYLCITWYHILHTLINIYWNSYTPRCVKESAFFSLWFLLLITSKYLC